MKRLIQRVLKIHKDKNRVKITLPSELMIMIKFVILAKFVSCYEGFCDPSAKKNITFSRIENHECCSIIKLTVKSNQGTLGLDNCLFDLSEDDNVYHLRQISAIQSYAVR